MGCNLDKFTTYDIGRVVHDNKTGSYSAQLVNAPASCPDKAFNSKVAAVAVIKGSNPTLSYSVTENRPVITVPKDNYVEEIGSSGWSTLSILLVVLAFGAAIYFVVRKLMQTSYETPVFASNSGAHIPVDSTQKRLYSGSNYNQRVYSPNPTPIYPVQQAAPVAPTVINNNNGSGSSGLVEGMILGEMLSNHSHTHETTIIEREVIERPSHSSSFSSDNDSSSYSSDSGSSSSYSSDDSSSSSYSSDSSSSYDSGFSSDSSSSFSSDSGSSFSSDS